MWEVGARLAEVAQSSMSFSEATQLPHSVRECGRVRTNTRDASLLVCSLAKLTSVDILVRRPVRLSLSHATA